MSLYVDLFIANNDLTLNPAGEPWLCDDRVSIAQDIKHLIRESGLLMGIIGERNRIAVADALQHLLLLIEDDERLVPGTVTITESSFELFYIEAETVSFGPLAFTAGLDLTDPKLTEIPTSLLFV